jgi:glycosyltransferase involved in cell wall biosynthesis
MKRILFYHPWPLADNPTRGSEIRPVRMVDAFRRCGFHVDLVIGYSKHRGRRMRAVRRAIENGRDYDFLYAESTTVPIPLADPHHLPVRPLQDVRFFQFLSDKGIPTGLFYRDVYWQVEDLKYDGSWVKQVVKRSFLWLEWWNFQRFVDHLFLPTREIRTLLPTEWPAERCSALPPGCEVADGDPSADGGPLELFYVGGVEPPYYDLRPLLKIVNQLDDVHLTLCCREPEWRANKAYYADISFGDPITIVHASSDEIGRFYRNADVVADLRRPEGYLRTALPVKTVEAIGYGVPTILRAGTSAAAFVEREGAGWTVDSLEDAGDLLEGLRDDRGRIREKRRDVFAAQQHHSWSARALQAAASLRSGPDSTTGEAQRQNHPSPTISEQTISASNSA